MSNFRLKRYNMRTIAVILLVTILLSGKNKYNAGNQFSYFILLFPDVKCPVIDSCI